MFYCTYCTLAPLGSPYALTCTLMYTILCLPTKQG